MDFVVVDSPLSRIVLAPAPATTPLEPAALFARSVSARVSGWMRFSFAGDDRAVYLADGHPLVATSTVLAERLGTSLVRRGFLTAPQLEIFLARAHKSGRRLASSLVADGVLDAVQRNDFVCEQYAERFLAIFAWSRAAFEFAPGPAPADEIVIDLPFERLLVEGLRRHYDERRLESVLHDPDYVPHWMPNAEGKLPLLGLTERERDSLVFVDGVRTSAAIADAAPVRVEGLRLVYAGLCLGLLA